MREESATKQYAASLGACLRRQSEGCATRKIGRHRNVFACGDIAGSVYYIESGQVKLLQTAISGKECLLTIYTSGDIFGEM